MESQKSTHKGLSMTLDILSIVLHIQSYWKDLPHLICPRSRDNVVWCDVVWWWGGGGGDVVGDDLLRGNFALYLYFFLFYLDLAPFRLFLFRFRFCFLSLGAVVNRTPLKSKTISRNPDQFHVHVEAALKYVLGPKHQSIPLTA